MSLRTNCESEGNGPAVSVGETAHVPAVPLVPPVVVVVVVVLEDVGLVGVSPLQAPVSAAPGGAQKAQRPAAADASACVLGDNHVPSIATPARA